MRVAVFLAATGFAAIAALGLLLRTADGTVVDHESVHYLPLPLDDAFVAEFERDIASGHFPNPWSASAAEVTWTEGCVVTLEVAIILPVFPASMSMSQAQRASMDRAVEILKAHETRHIAIWRNYAAEVKRLGCVTVPRDPWKAQVDADNQRTNFGFAPGFAEWRHP